MHEQDTTWFRRHPALIAISAVAAQLQMIWSGAPPRLRQRLMVVSMGNIGVLSVRCRISRGYASHESMERGAMDAPNAVCNLPEVQ